jgi:hypothetical protein
MNVAENGQLGGEETGRLFCDLHKPDMRLGPQRLNRMGAKTIDESKIGNYI